MGTKVKMPATSFGRGQANKNGINILDVDDTTFRGIYNDIKKDALEKSGKTLPEDEVLRLGNEVFWEQYNLPFLEKAFKRGDDIRLLSEPVTLFSGSGFYLREIEVIVKGWKKRMEKN